MVVEVFLLLVFTIGRTCLSVRLVYLWCRPLRWVFSTTRNRVRSFCTVDSFNLIGQSPDHSNHPRWSLLYSCVHFITQLFAKIRRRCLQTSMSKEGQLLISFFFFFLESGLQWSHWLLDRTVPYYKSAHLAIQRKVTLYKNVSLCKFGIKGKI